MALFNSALLCKTVVELKRKLTLNTNAYQRHLQFALHGLPVRNVKQPGPFAKSRLYGKSYVAIPTDTHRTNVHALAAAPAPGLNK